MPARWFAQRQSKRPRVLLIGDSITGGYGPEAVQFAASQDLDGSLALRADRDSKYRSYAELIDLDAIAGKEL